MHDAIRMDDAAQESIPEREGDFLVVLGRLAEVTWLLGLALALE